MKPARDIHRITDDAIDLVLTSLSEIARMRASNDQIRLDISRCQTLLDEAWQAIRRASELSDADGHKVQGLSDRR